MDRVAEPAARTANAARTSLNGALTIALRAGAVMGFVVVGLGLLDICVWFIVISRIYPVGEGEGQNLAIITTTLLTFGMGASTQALFARVGGGIFTKAADVGVDLVGKVEAGIPEDDPRNPATIAGNVGDIVGDVAGMGADLYESYCGSLFATAALGVVTGIVIGKATEYFTASSHGPTRSIAESARTGPATVIIAGLGTGMQSTAVSVISVVAATLAAYALGGDFDSSNVEKGLYGIGLASVGMLATLGITLATDAHGPIADNAGGNAQMSGLDESVRTRTDALDSLGNTTAATGKGYAIGSAALTALALFASYIEELKVGLLRIGHVTLDFGGGRTIPTINARLVDFMAYYQVHLMNPKVVLGAFIGSMMAFLFCGLAINAVGRAAGKMVTEVRRQFQEIRGILEGTAEPDYARCVEISTWGAQLEMILPSALAILVPIVVGIGIGVAGVLGLLVGGLTTGFVLAIFMANAGGAWDNAKKYIEEGNLGGKGSQAHKAAVIGDTVGDPFKDTAGPSLNILIKLMSMVAIVMAGLTVAYSMG